MSLTMFSRSRFDWHRYYLSHVQNNPVSFNSSWLPSVWSHSLLHCYPFRQVGLYTVKSHPQSRVPPHPQSGYLPTPFWELRAPRVQRCLAGLKLLEMILYALSCSCTKRDHGSFYFQKRSESGFLELFLDSSKGGLGSRYSAWLSTSCSLLIHSGSVPGWTKCSGAPWLLRRTLAQETQPRQDGNPGHL